jgi:hypothetical protein
MENTYQIGSLTAAGSEDADKKALPGKAMPNYRDVFHPKDTGRLEDRTVHSEPSQRVTNYLEIARLVRPKSSDSE